MSTAVVSGGSRGIGRAICLDLAKNGYNIAFNYIESDDDSARTGRKWARPLRNARD